jgi:hypothetical protein
MVDKLGTEIDNHDFFNTLIFDIELPDECEKFSLNLLTCGI